MIDAEKPVSQRIWRIADVAQEPHDCPQPIRDYQRAPLVSLEAAIEPLIGFSPTLATHAHLVKQHSDESAAIMLWSMDWQPRDQCLYTMLNATLRSSSRDELKPWYLYLRLLFSGLFQLPSVSATVYRCVNADLSEKYTMGKTVVWRGFSLCTTSLQSLQSENVLHQTGPRTLFIIECHSGKDIREHSSCPAADELLLPGGTSLQVVDYLRQGDLHLVCLREVPTVSSLSQLVPLVSVSMSRSNSLYHHGNATDSRTDMGTADSRSIALQLGIVEKIADTHAVHAANSSNVTPAAVPQSQVGTNHRHQAA